MGNPITLSDNPCDYGLPHEYNEWYPSQREVTERAVNLPDGKILLIDLPTGGGKSLIPMAVSHFRKGTVVMMSTRDLQIQYEQSFPNASVIWGQSNYSCIDPINIAACTKMYSESPNRTDCPFDSYSEAKEGCELFYSCPYEVAKRKAFGAQARILNYHYGYFATWWKDAEKGKLDWDLFCDEAHR